MNFQDQETWKTLGMLMHAHPWHGVSIGEEAPKLVNTYIETVPSDTVKYEIDKISGILKVARPQKYSSICPTLYGFIPQTYCSQSVAELSQERTGRTAVRGDGDPLDICVLTEKVISHGSIIVRAIPIGGFRMIDQGEADDKIIAVMYGDGLYSQWENIEDCPKAFIDRLKHYFLTYKDLPGTQERICEITHVYGREEAMEVIKRSRQDYLSRFRRIEEMMKELLAN